MRNKSIIISIFLFILILIGNLNILNSVNIPSGIPQSAEDSYEQNDTYSTAYNISTSYTYLNLYAAHLDDDWFKFYITANNIFDCRIVWSGTGELSLSLFKVENIKLTQSRLDYCCEGNISYYINESGVYYILLAHGGPFAGTTYNLTLTSRSDDIYEINDQFSTARLMDNYKNYRMLTIYPDNEDWYNIYFEANSLISIGIKGGLGSALNLYLYDSTHHLLNQSFGQSQNQIVNYSIQSAGFYRVQVTLSSESMTYYDMSINGEDDLFEPNNDMTEAQSLSSGLPFTLILLPNESDWFTMNILTPTNLILKLESDEISELECALYDENNLDFTPTVTENANYVEFTYAINTAGNYYIEIYSESLVPIHYTLSYTEEANYSPFEFPFEYLIYLIPVAAVVGIILWIRNRRTKSLHGETISFKTKSVRQSPLSNVELSTNHTAQTLWGFSSHGNFKDQDSDEIPKPGTFFMTTNDKKRH